MKAFSHIHFPKITKKIGNFVSDESGNVTTRAALSIGAIGAIGVGINEAFASCYITNNGHFNGTTNGHYNGSAQGAAYGASGVGPQACWENSSYNYEYSCGPMSCSPNPISGVVNGHYNITPSCTIATNLQHCNHLSSGSGSGSGGDDSCG